MAKNPEIKVSVYRQSGISDLQAVVVGTPGYYEARIYGGWYVGRGETREKAVENVLARMQKEMDLLRIRVKDNEENPPETA